MLSLLLFVTVAGCSYSSLVLFFLHCLNTAEPATHLATFTMRIYPVYFVSRDGVACEDRPNRLSSFRQGYSASDRIRRQEKRTGSVHTFSSYIYLMYHCSLYVRGFAHPLMIFPSDLLPCHNTCTCISICQYIHFLKAYPQTFAGTITQ